MKQSKEEIIFAYVGDGLGVPGLPGRVTMREAEALGVADILKAALENGNFIDAAKVLEKTPDKPQQEA